MGTAGTVSSPRHRFRPHRDVSAILEDRWGVVALVVACGLTLWLVAPMWPGGPPAGDDSVAHLIRAEYGLEHFVAKGRLDGWQPSFALGYQEFLFVGPVPTWIVGLARAASLGHLSVLGALKISIAASFIGLLLAVGFLARSLGLDRRASGVAALLSLALSSPFGGVGFDGIFGFGLLPHQWGTVLLCVSLGSALRLAVEPTRARWIVATGVATAALAATHGPSTILLGIVLPLVLGLLLLYRLLCRALLAVPPPVAPSPRRTPGRGRKKARKGSGSRQRSAPSADAPTASTTHGPWVETTIPVGEAHPYRVGKSLVVAMGFAAVLSAFALVPLVAHRDLGGSLTAFEAIPLSDLLARIWHGRLIFRPGVAVLVLLGWLFGLLHLRRGRPLQFACLATPPLFLLVGVALQGLMPDNIVSIQPLSRGLALCGIIAVLPLAAFVTQLANRAPRPWRGGAAVAVAAAIVLVPLGSYRELARSVRPKPVMFEAAAQLRRLVPDGARFATQHNDDNRHEDVSLAGMTHADFWLAWASGRPTLNVFNLESSSTPYPATEPTLMLRRPPENAADLLVRYGVTHVMVLDTAQAQSTLASSRFTVVWSKSSMAILEVHAREGRPAPASLLTADEPVRANLVGTDPEHLRIAVSTDRPTAATVAVAWSPKWHAAVDGKPVALGRTDEGLLSVGLPVSTSSLSLDFRSDAWDRAGAAVSSIAILSLAVWGVRQRRNRR